MQPETTPQARTDALAELKAEAARFAATGASGQGAEGAGGQRPPTPKQRPRTAPKAKPAKVVAAPGGDDGGSAVLPAAYVPNAVAPERGNTRPLVPVDGRLHLRAAPAMIEALDDAVAALRRTNPKGLRDLERATLVRIGAAVVLADVNAHGANGLIGEAVRAALDPAQRHLDVPMPDPIRWLRSTPQGDR